MNQEHPWLRDARNLDAGYKFFNAIEGTLKGIAGFLYRYVLTSFALLPAMILPSILSKLAADTNRGIRYSRPVSYLVFSTFMFSVCAAPLVMEYMDANDPIRPQEFEKFSVQTTIDYQRIVADEFSNISASRFVFLTLPAMLYVTCVGHLIWFLFRGQTDRGARDIVDALALVIGFQLLTISVAGFVLQHEICEFRQDRLFLMLCFVCALHGAAVSKTIFNLDGLMHSIGMPALLLFVTGFAISIQGWIVYNQTQGYIEQRIVGSKFDVRSGPAVLKAGKVSLSLLLANSSSETLYLARSPVYVEFGLTALDVHYAKTSANINSWGAGDSQVMMVGKDENMWLNITIEDKGGFSDIPMRLEDGYPTELYAKVILRTLDTRKLNANESLLINEVVVTYLFSEETMFVTKSEFDEILKKTDELSGK